MARASGWRVHCPESIQVFQRQVLSGESHLFLVHQTGPTGFVVKEEKKRVALKVTIGDPHSCTCRSYRLSRDLCLHICWTLLRKLQLHTDDPLSHQLGLLPREVSSLLSVEKLTDASVSIRKKVVDKLPNDELTTVTRRVITPRVSCPICLEELLERKKPVSHCRHGCGNPVHISCMKILARHQVENLPASTCGNTMLSCPLCRGDFATWSELQEEARNAPNPEGRIPRKSAATGNILAKNTSGPHTGIKCSFCLTSPVYGLLHRCMQCPHVILCEACTKDKGTMRFHGGHGLVVREKPGARWRPVSPSFQVQPVTSPRPVRGRRPSASGNREKLRKSLDNVYEQFSKKDASVDPDAKCLPATLVAQLPTWKVRGGSKLLLKGQQCCLCLNQYKVKQLVRNLPCGHQFHAKCISHWLQNSSATCPLDSADVARTLMQKAAQRRELAVENCPQPTRKTISPPPALRGGNQGPPEVSVRRVCLADRRLPSPSAHTSPRPVFLVTTEQGGPNRGYPLPARPLLGGNPRSLSSGSASPRIRSPSPAEEGYQNEQESSSPLNSGFGGHGVVAPALSITSLCLSLQQGGEATRRQRGGNDEGRRGRRGVEVDQGADRVGNPGQYRRRVPGSVPRDSLATGDPLTDYDGNPGQPRRRGVVPGSVPRDPLATGDPLTDFDGNPGQPRRRGVVPGYLSRDPLPDYDGTGRSDLAALMDIRCLRVRLSERIVANRERRNY